MFTRTTFVALSFCVVATASVSSQSTVIELNDAGWQALRAQNPDRAAALFREALTVEPDDAVLLFGAGAAARAQGKPREALALLQRAVEHKPRLIEASRLLGQIAYEQGDVALAIRTYEHALKYAPTDAAIGRALAAVRADADVHHSFEERRYDRFHVMFEGRAEESLAARATEVMNSAFWRIGEKLGAYPSDAVVAMLYTEKQFRDITRAPEWSGGQYDGRIRIPVAGATLEPELFERVLTHELTHAIVAHIAPKGVPAWMHEGLAQYFDGSNPHDARARLKAFGRIVPLGNLETGFGRFNATQAQIAYDESLLAVSVILDRPGFGWTRLFHALSAGQPVDRVLDSFGFSYADLESGFTQK